MTSFSFLRTSCTLAFRLPVSLTLLVAIAAVPVTSFAADKSADAAAANSGTTLVKEDIAFLQGANQGGMLEVKTSELAIKRNALAGTDLEFAKKMIDEHKKINKELADLATKKGLVPNEGFDEGMQKKYDDLVKTDDAKLLKEYRACQVKSHKMAVSAFKDAADDCKDVDVKAFAAKHLPHLQAHLDEAKRLEDTK